MLAAAFTDFFDAASAACMEETAQAVHKLLRRAHCGDDAILERLLVDSDITGATTVESALLLVHDMPEARALRQEWDSYRGALVTRPEIQGFFRGHDHDPWYARRCMSAITLGGLFDNVFWNATGSFHPPEPRLLTLLKQEVFKQDELGRGGGNSAKRHKKMSDPSTVVTVEQRTEELAQLRTVCMRTLEESQLQWKSKQRTEQRKQQEIQARFDPVLGALADLQSLLNQAVQAIDHARAAPITDAQRTAQVQGAMQFAVEWFKKNKDRELREDAIRNLQAKTNSHRDHKADLPRLPPPRVLQQWAQTKFDNRVRAILARAMHAGRELLEPLRGTAVDKTLQVLEEHTASNPVLLEALAAKSGQLLPEVQAHLNWHADEAGLRVCSAVYQVLMQEEKTRAAAPAAAGGLGAGHAAVAASAREEARHTEMWNASVRAFIDSPGQHLQACMGDGFRFLDELDGLNVDFARVRAEEDLDARAFLADFAATIESDVLVEVREICATAQKDANPSALAPLPLVTATLPVFTPWHIDMACFRTYRTKLLAIAHSELKAPPAGHYLYAQRLADVLRIESMGRSSSADPVAFETAIWKPTCALWSLLLFWQLQH